MRKRSSARRKSFVDSEISREVGDPTERSIESEVLSSVSRAPPPGSTLGSRISTRGSDALSRVFSIPCTGILWTSKLRRFNQDSYEILHFVRTLESYRIPNRCGNYHSSRNHEPSATFPLEICGNYHEKVGATDYYLSYAENQPYVSTRREKH